MYAEVLSIEFPAFDLSIYAHPVLTDRQVLSIAVHGRLRPAIAALSSLPLIH